MHPLTKATQLTADASASPLSDADLAQLYAYPQTPRAGVVIRANMVGSIDAAATVDGRSGDLGSDGDRQLFMVLRALADVVVVGARTAFTEEYGPLRTHESLAGLRRGLGQTPTGKLVLLSNCLDFPADNPLVTDPGTIIATCAGAPGDARARLSDVGATIVDCGDGKVDLAALCRYLAAAGTWRVLCEGGPSLLGSLVAADLLDELSVTVSPLLTAGDGIHITAGEGTARPMRRAHVLGDDQDYLYIRWVREQG